MNKDKGIVSSSPSYIKSYERHGAGVWCNWRRSTNNWTEANKGVDTTRGTAHCTLWSKSIRPSVHNIFPDLMCFCGKNHETFQRPTTSTCMFVTESGRNG